MQSKMFVFTFAVYRLYGNIILPLVLYGYKARSSFNGKKVGCGYKVRRKIRPKRAEEIREWGKFHNEDL
jgi:hypothetical protein